MSKIGKLVREKRKDRKLSQGILASKAGISRTYLSQIESGVAQNISIDVLEGISIALGVTPSYFLNQASTDDFTISNSLAEFATEEKLSFQDLVTLEKVTFNSKKPQNKDDWRKLHSAIKDALDNIE